MAATAPPPPPSLLFFNGLLILAFLSIPFIALRILFLLPPLRPPPRPRRRPGGPSTLEQKDSTANPLLTSSSSDASPAEPTRLLVVLGSGGHTAEMLAMLRKLDARTFLRSWSTRTYVISEGDSLSAERAREFEESLLLLVGLGADQKDTGAEGKRDDDGGVGGVRTAPVVDAGTYALHAVPRARRVHQPLLTTPLSALRCLRACVAIVRAPRPPDLVLTNGPGTAVVVVLTALLLRFLDVGDAARTSRVRTVYVESWARVRRLSLSGRLLLRVVDRFLVQWEGLVEKTGGRGEFLGVLV